MHRKRGFPIVASVVIVVLVVAFFAMKEDGSTGPAVAPVVGSEQPRSVDAGDRPIATLRDLNNAFVEISRVVTPTVVTVFTEKVFRVRQRTDPFSGSPFEEFFGDFFGGPRGAQPPREEEYVQRGLGSGVIVSEDGYILTNDHVVAEADTINVRLIDGRTLPAKVVGTDPKTDIAVLKVEAENLSAIELGDSDGLEVGEWVLAVGSPLSASLAHTVTSGIVSAKGRSNVGLAEYEDFIQTDAAINPGNSGGALIDLDGKLVGINSAIATQSGGFQGIGFAVPVNMAQRIMKALVEFGTVTRGWLGVYIQNVDETMEKAMKLPGGGGALVADVTPDGPADKAGLKHGDVITEMDGKKVENTTQLRNAVAATAPGTKVKLKVIRDGKTRTISVTLGKLGTDQVASETEEKLSKTFGFRVAPLDRDLAEKYQLDKSLKGVVITGIDQSSPAYRAGLNEGDLIVAVNKTRFKDLEAFNELIERLKRGDTVVFRVVRRNRGFFVAFTL